jgi:foldase protein PrsA
VPYGFVARVAASLVAVTLIACSRDETVMTVGGDAITKGQLEAKLYASPAAEQMLQQMAQTIALDQYAEKNGITVSDAEIAQKESMLASSYPAGSWEQAMASRGLTRDDVRAALRSQIILDKAVGRSVSISDSQVRDYFERNRARFDTPTHKATLASAHDAIVDELRRQQEGPLVAPFLQKLMQSSKIVGHDPRFADLFSSN